MAVFVGFAVRLWFAPRRFGLVGLVGLVGPVRFVGLVSVGLVRLVGLVSVGLLGLDARGRAPLQRATPRGKVVGASSRSRGGVGARAAGGWALRLLGEGLSQGGLGREGQRGDCEDRDEDAGAVHGDDVVCVRAGTVRVRLVVMTGRRARGAFVWLSTLREPLLCVSSFHRLRGAPFAVSERGVEPSCIPRRRATLESVKCPRFCACSGHVD